MIGEFCLVLGELVWPFGWVLTSDRFHFVYRFLGLPYTDVTLLPAGAVKGKL